jgi:TubC N-terminal docking domain
MNIPELMTELIQKGVQFQIDESKVKISSAQAVLTEDILAKLSEHKPEILSFLSSQKSQDSSVTNTLHPSLDTIGRLISGFSNLETSQNYRSPMIDVKSMTRKLAVTFRPIEQNKSLEILQIFSNELEDNLRDLGTRVVSWEEATREYQYELKIPILGWKKTFKTRMVKPEINAVIDSKRKPTLLGRARIVLADLFYFVYAHFFAKGQKISVSRIAMLTGWAEKHVALQLEDPINTQVVMLTELNREFVNPRLPYYQKVTIGLNTLVDTFSEIVIGVSSDRLSILNMNLSDSTFLRFEIDNFVLNSLIPKVFVPILPLSISQFECGQYDPQASAYAKKLAELGRELLVTDLFPPGSQLSQVVKRKSHRDLVDVLVNGRTGVSYGFLAYVEPPQYFGSPEIIETEWDCLQPVAGFSSSELRQNEAQRWYIKTLDRAGHNCFKQIPDIWLVSSRSGANKTDLSLDRDITRIGLKQGLFLQIPQGVNLERTDIKPSYDIYVMLAIALSVALYLPELIANGCPIVHFHGYPSSQWFKSSEYWTGTSNPSVPCGTYEAGVLNYLGIQHLAQQHRDRINLIGLIEPDHGTNIIAHSLEYLIDRLKTGCDTGDIKLGGEYFTSLKEVVP